MWCIVTYCTLEVGEKEKIKSVFDGSNFYFRLRFEELFPLLLYHVHLLFLVHLLRRPVLLLHAEEYEFVFFS